MNADRSPAVRSAVHQDHRRPPRPTRSSPPGAARRQCLHRVGAGVKARISAGASRRNSWKTTDAAARGDRSQPRAQRTTDERSYYSLP
jgi:hypothetical protein